MATEYPHPDPGWRTKGAVARRRVVSARFGAVLGLAAGIKNNLVLTVKFLHRPRLYEFVRKPRRMGQQVADCDVSLHRYGD